MALELCDWIEAGVEAADDEEWGGGVVMTDKGAGTGTAVLATALAYVFSPPALVTSANGTGLTYTVRQGE